MHARLDVWSRKDGLPSSQVNALTQSTDGYLWLGTPEGLVRFDGARFVVHNQSNQPKMLARSVLALAARRDGGVWLMTARGLHVMKHGVIEPVQFEKATVSSIAIALHVSGDGALHMQTHRGMLRILETGEMEIVTPPELEGLEAQQIGAGLVSTEDGSTWIGSPFLTQFRGQEKTVYDVKMAFVISPDREGGVWAATEGLNVVHVRGGQILERYGRQDGIRGDEPHFVLAGSAGDVWISTSAGITRIFKGKIESLDIDSGLSSQVVRPVLEDFEGNIWLGTDGGGIVRLRDVPVVSIGKREGLPVQTLRAVAADSTGNLWVADDRGVYRENRGSWTLVPETLPIGSSHIAVLATGPDDSVWMGTHGQGLFRLRAGQLESIPFAAPYPVHLIFALFVEGENDAWIADNRGSVFHYDGKVAKMVIEGDGLPIPMLFRRSNGDLLVGTTLKGLRKLVDGRFDLVAPADAPTAKMRFTDALEDPDGTVWLAGSRGVVRLRGETAHALLPAHGIPNTAITVVLDDGLGSLWLGTSEGLHRISRTSIEAALAEKGRVVERANFSFEEGFRSGGIIPGSGNSMGCVLGGRLIFAGFDGLGIVEPRRLYPNLSPPLPQIESAVVGGQVHELSQGAPLYVPPRTDRIEVWFTAPCLRSPKQTKFQYRLIGLDEDWIDAAGQRSAVFTALAPDTYRFEVRAVNESGVESINPALLTLEVAPTWYQSRLFRAAAVLVLIALVVSTYIVRVRGYAKRQAELESTIVARTGELREANTRLGHANDELARANTTLEVRVEEGVARLRESERMAAYGQMVASVAHEIRHPVFALQAAAFVIGRKTAAMSQELASQLRTLDSETARIARLMDDLLQFARQESLVLNTTPLDMLLRDACEVFGAGAGAAAPPIESTIVPLDLRWSLDRDRILQVLVNLFENARKHATGLTRIRVSADLNAESGALRIDVADDGAGIAPGILPRIFEPFATGGSGTGLGLAIARRIVEQHRGRLFVTSTGASGTVFTLEFASDRPRVVASQIVSQRSP
ncbi:MAG: ATP-binding protein [Planctomycetota bacterium]